MNAKGLTTDGHTAASRPRRRWSRYATGHPLTREEPAHGRRACTSRNHRCRASRRERGVSIGGEEGVGGSSWHSLTMSASAYPCDACVVENEESQLRRRPVVRKL